MGPWSKAAHDGLTGFKMYISACPGKLVFGWLNKCCHCEERSDVAIP